MPPSKLTVNCYDKQFLSCGELQGLKSIKSVHTGSRIRLTGQVVREIISSEADSRKLFYWRSGKDLGSVEDKIRRGSDHNNAVIAVKRGLIFKNIPVNVITVRSILHPFIDHQAAEGKPGGNLIEKYAGQAPAALIMEGYL